MKIRSVAIVGGIVLGAAALASIFADSAGDARSEERPVVRDRVTEATFGSAEEYRAFVEETEAATPIAIDIGALTEVVDVEGGADTIDYSAIPMSLASARFWSTCRILDADGSLIHSSGGNDDQGYAISGNDFGMVSRPAAIAIEECARAVQTTDLGMRVEYTTEQLRTPNGVVGTDEPILIASEEDRDAMIMRLRGASYAMGLPRPSTPGASG